MGLFHWGAEYHVGVHDIDEQHKKIVDLINELHDAMIAGRSGAILARVLDETIDYARFHLKSEEDLMAAFDYPDRDQHKAEHDLFLVRLRAFRARHESGEEQVSLKTVMFLVDWLAEHNHGLDAKLGKFLNAKGGGR